ncbi:signal transduction histidine kinase [Candidatus Scalindua japonica]|uniref:histidine kinase n=1 Tax=Candidatus Scalindua japonica TaxID=1284222 RepID=A0A286U1S9_9BACT|nr:hybrid sensor histidine kinase/response regulator [Candidatus Scalindua japonica]GAX62094.1 signal transduction histidine kinase [Candidatus Scalindua japonica]
MNITETSINYKILAVFRDDENLRAAIKLFENQGYDFSSETCIFQAIAAVTERKVDAIILDIDDLSLKDLEFLDVVKKINPNLYILISFCNSNREKALKYLERGADCYILKPFYISELCAIVHKFSERVSQNGNCLQESSETDKSIEHLALRIAQEINNPLTTISGQLQLRLSKMENSNPDYHIFETLEEEAQRIAETVKSLITFAQLGEPDKEVLNINDIIEDIICSIKDTWQERDIRIVESLDKNLPAIKADKDQMTLACKNIISNSRKAIHGKGYLKIVTNMGIDNNINITFYDSGRGIPSGSVERVFDPFFVINEEERGMGLGLCVAYDIVKRHGGSLTVKSEKEELTVFQITIPIDTA